MLCKHFACLLSIVSRGMACDDMADESHEVNCRTGRTWTNWKMFRDHALHDLITL